MGIDTLTVMESVRKMAAQLRQDYLYLLFHNYKLPVTKREDVNQQYCFQFPEGSFFALILRANSKITGQSISPAWIECARNMLRETLHSIPGDFETMIHGNQLFAICGTTASPEEVSALLTELFDALLHAQQMYTADWTLGLGSFVPDLPELSRSVAMAQHALKQSIIHGCGKFYNGNIQPAIYEEGLELISSSEKLCLQQTISDQRFSQIPDQIAGLFARKQSQIRHYPVFAYMLALHILGITLQILRENMPVDRTTYELEQQYETSVDELATLNELIQHVSDGVTALCHRYALFLENGKSKPVWIILSYIQEHYAEKITLNELAAKLHRNPQYVSSAFSKECGMSITEYITSIRMQHAKQLLRTTDTPIGTIGSMVGYQDPQYFSRVFYRTSGIYPREYRQRKTETRNR